MKAGAFAAENEDAVGAEIEVGVIGRAALVEAQYPDVGFLHLFQGADEVGDAGDADVLGGSGGRFGDGCGDGRGAAFGEDNSVDSGAIGGADESAEIVWVFDAIEGEEEAVLLRLALLGGEEIFDGEEGSLADHGNGALVGVSAGDSGEVVAGLERDAEASGAAQLGESFEPLIFAVAGKHDAIETARTGSDRLLHGVQAVQNFHRASLLGIGFGWVVAPFRGGTPPWYIPRFC